MLGCPRDDHDIGSRILAGTMGEAEDGAFQGTQKVEGKKEQCGYGSLIHTAVYTLGDSGSM